MNQLVQAFSATAGGAEPAYIEDVFSTYLYTGNGSTQTINNGIDLAGKGGLVWIKGRSLLSNHRFVDTSRGAGNAIFSDTNGASAVQATGLTAFTASGFSLGSSAGYNNSGDTYASWSFRKTPKFYTHLTFTGTGAAQAIAHDLGAVPGCIIVKNITSNGNWFVYHRSLGNGSVAYLNFADPPDPADYWNNTTPTSTQFSVKSETSLAGQTYVAYLFAHDAGGFGLTGTDNVISCGSFTTDGSGNATVSLGYEPQYILYKKSSDVGQWYVEDAMRGLYAPSQIGTTLIANLSNAESAGNGSLWLNSTGFTVNPAMNLGANATCIYIAIRRGPMKTPTSGASVFAPVVQTPPSGPQTITTNFPVDLAIFRPRTLADGGLPIFIDRLRGSSQSSSRWLSSSDTSSETNFSTRGFGLDNNTGYVDNLSSGIGYAGLSEIFWNLRRAPSFMDEVCYSGTGVATTVTHNLGVVPELMIVKERGNANAWSVYAAPIGAGKALVLNLTNAEVTSTIWNSTTPTASVFSVGTGTTVNRSAGTYVAYLFATCAGVSKVGSFTGTGATQVINCGFAAGARFVLIKSTSTTGDWLVWDSARGIVAGNDPYLALNSTAAEVTSTDWVDTAATGFELSNAGGNLANSNGVSYIYLAIS